MTGTWPVCDDKDHANVTDDDDDNDDDDGVQGGQYVLTPCD